MNDRIKYKSSSLTAASSELTRLADVLEDVSRDLSRIDTSGKWWTKLNINTHAGRYDARGALRVMINDADKARDYAADITDGIRDAQRLFDEADRKVLSAAKAAATGKGNDYDKNDASGSSGFKRIGDNFDLKALLLKAASSFGPMGSLFGTGVAIYKAATGGDWVSAAKSTAKSMVSWSQFTSKYKWTNYAKTNRFGYGYGTTNYIKRLFGVTQKGGSRAGSWASRFSSNFDEALKGTFRKFNPDINGPDYKPNWFGIAGLTLDFAFNGINNAKQVAAGEITADRAFVETFAETGANLLITTAAGAAAAALLPVTAPAAVVAVAGGAIVWAADGVTKWVTGGDKGLGELASEGVGWVWDNTFGKLIHGKKK